MLGYDLDGTICESGPQRGKPFFHSTGEERRAFNELRRQHYLTAAVIRIPNDPFVIITGRSEKYRDETEVWLSNNNINPVDLCMLTSSRTRDNMIAHKIAACKRFDVIRYYEDDKKIALALSAAGIQVVLVG